MGKRRQETSTKQNLKHRIRELQKRASKDELSGLLNRATAEEYINERLRAMTEEDVCALFIVDIDNFKSVNDTLGHMAGDQAIRRFAQILSGIFRAKDIVARLGGDEFIAFMSGPVTEREIREKGSAICSGMQMILGDNPSVSLTASVGIYMATGNSHHFDDLYRSADMALYRAKKNGKNSYRVKRGHDPLPLDEDVQPVNSIPFSMLLEYMDSGVGLLEMGDPIKIIYVSPGLCRILGKTPEEFVVPCNLGDFVHPDDMLEFEELLRKGVRDEKTVEFTHRVSADGKEWRWWNVRASRISYNNPYPVMLATTTDISDFKINERRLEEINLRLKLALKQTTERVWEVDIAERKFYMYDRNGDRIPFWDEDNEFPRALIDTGLIHPDSVSRFREFARELINGKMQGFGNFVMRNVSTGCYGWVTLSYKTALDDMGRAVRAIGILESMPRNFNATGVASVLRRPLPEALRSALILGMRANLSRDTVLELWTEGRNRDESNGEASCSACLEDSLNYLFNEDDKLKYSSLFSTDELAEMFRSGERWVWVEYQRMTEGGDVQWVSHIANLVADPLTDEIYMFLYVFNIDRRHSREFEVKGAPVRDPVTRLYTKQAARDIMNAMLKNAGSEECTAAVIDIGGLANLCDEDDSSPDKIRFYLAAAFSVSLGADCVPARYSEDQLLILVPDSVPGYEIRSRLESVFSFVRLVLADTVDLEGVRFVAGVVTARAATANIIAMSSQALSLCSLWKNASSDTVAFPHEGDDWSWTNLHTDIGEDQVDVHHEEMDRPLSDSERDVAFNCMSAMLASDSLEASIQGVLSYLGDYYRADRVYILTLSAGGRIVTMPYEWTDGKKPGIQQTVSGSMITKFPLLERCMKERAPVFLTRENPISLQGEPPVEGTWHFTAFPLMEKDVITGFLCIENAGEHPADAALFSTLIPYILKEKDRYGSEHPGSVGPETSGRALDIPNLRFYMEAISKFNSDRFNSMGAVCLDIPDLSSINSSLGFEHGNRMLWYVSKSLTDIFGPGNVFHTWDAEFVAMCPNTTKQVFEGRCLRLRSLLKRRYPRELRMGFDWSDGKFKARDLVNEAKSRMLGEAKNGLWESGAGSRHDPEDTPGAGIFKVYLQPKINMHTGKLYGAEALARCFNEDGTMILPGEFISQLEQNGGIRNLDLFVLDRTLARQESWIEQGFGTVPVSVNLSRETLLGPTALASVLAIQSRYPQVPAEALELEVTESVGSETGELQEAIDRFRHCGLRIGLDDFGSKYANLSIFANVRFDTVKLDRSLVTGLPGNPINRMLIKDIVSICETYGSDCIAEGVETKEQIKALTDIGCRYAQGFYYDRPMPEEQFEQKYLSVKTEENRSGGSQ